MANAATLAQNDPVRMMLVGYPGGGKTGAIASVANLGYKLRILDFEGNLKPLFMYTKPEFLQNIDVLYFEDKMRNGPHGLEPLGKPKAFASALDAMDEWKSIDPTTGEEISLGKSKEWGPDTVVVLDSLTSMGEAAMNLARNRLNKTRINTTQQVWGLAQTDQDLFIDQLTSKNNGFHVIVLAHLKTISPKDVQKGDSDLTVEIKQKLADIVPTKLFPSALGQALPPTIGGHFPIILEARREVKQGKIVRVISQDTGLELDTKLPINLADYDMKGTLPIGTALADIFKVLAPSFEGMSDTQKGESK